jgi:hypothetical protein
MKQKFRLLNISTWGTKLLCPRTNHDYKGTTNLVYETKIVLCGSSIKYRTKISSTIEIKNVECMEQICVLLGTNNNYMWTQKLSTSGTNPCYKVEHNFRLNETKK